MSSAPGVCYTELPSSILELIFLLNLKYTQLNMLKPKTKVYYVDPSFCRDGGIWRLLYGLAKWLRDDLLFELRNNQNIIHVQ